MSSSGNSTLVPVEVAAAVDSLRFLVQLLMSILRAAKTLEASTSKVEELETLVVTVLEGAEEEVTEDKTGTEAAETIEFSLISGVQTSDTS